MNREGKNLNSGIPGSRPINAKPDSDPTQFLTEDTVDSSIRKPFHICSTSPRESTKKQTELVQISDAANGSNLLLTGTLGGTSHSELSCSVIMLEHGTYSD